jgi:zinc D-Ala-D-Ala carboxypeptidase
MGYGGGSDSCKTERMDMMYFFKKTNATAIDHTKLSEHLELHEVECRCRDPKCFYTLIHPLVLLSFEKLREYCGDRPLHINSGFRCQSHNEKSKGVEKSKHCIGLAIDIQVPHYLTMQELKLNAESAGFSFVKEYKRDGFLHCHIDL